jgi:hypothetical protein
MGLPDGAGGIRACQGNSEIQPKARLCYSGLKIPHLSPLQSMTKIWCELHAGRVHSHIKDCNSLNCIILHM